MIQRDCHKWKCYLITLNLVFIDFWDISRLHILGGLLFKPTLNQNRHFWLLGPNFFHMVFLGPEITCSFTQFFINPIFWSRKSQILWEHITPISWQIFECLCFSGKCPFNCSVDCLLPDRLDLRPFLRWAPQKGKCPKFLSANNEIWQHRLSHTKINFDGPTYGVT